jgi:hypothetical protein
MGNVNSGMETVKTHQKKVLRVKNTTKMKGGFHGFIIPCTWLRRGQ